MSKDTILISSYPRSGNTMLTTWFNMAGKHPGNNDYNLQKDNKNYKNQPNLLFKEKILILKTHNMWLPDCDINKLYSGRVIKVITLVRNPFDTFLSCINFIKIRYRNKWNNRDAKFLNFLTDNYPLNKKTFEEWNLENLRDNGLLDTMFKKFMPNGTFGLFPLIYGNWFSHPRSYDCSKLPVFNLRYEDIIDDLNKVGSNNESFKELSNFLDIDYSLLKDAAIRQNNSAKRNHEGNRKIFYNKMRSNYWEEYLDVDKCRNFASRNYVYLKLNGYSDLLDYLFKSN